MTDRPKVDSPDDQALPPQLVDDLRTLSRSRCYVPAEVDQRIVDEAQQHLATVARRYPMPWWVAAAAVITLAATLAIFWQHQDHPAVTRPAHVAADLDGNGKLDILDAFALARQLQSSAPHDPACDVNHDGAVDRADVDAIAQLAVRLPEEAKS